MFNVIDYVFWILGAVFTLFWIVLFFKGKKNAGLFAGLDEKQYPLKYKMKTLVLWLCPGFYNFMIRGIRKARDKKAD